MSSHHLHSSHRIQPQQDRDTALVTQGASENINYEIIQDSYRDWKDYNRWKTLPITHTPAYLIDNPYLLNHHRPQLCSLTLCLLSVLRLHVSTLPIWSCLLLTSALLFLMAYYAVNMAGSSMERLILSVVLITVNVARFNSFLFHIFRAHSAALSKFLCRISLCGSIIELASMSIVWLYFTFYCNMWKCIHSITVSVVVVVVLLLTLRTTFTEKSDSHTYKQTLVLTYLFLIFYNAVALIQSAHLEGFQQFIEHLAVGWFILCFSCSFLSAALEFSQIPERFWPGKFDVFFSSAALSIFMIIVSIGVYSVGFLRLYYYRISKNTCQGK